MADVEQWTRARLGRPVRLHPVEGPHQQARVWRVDDDGRVLAYLKLHRVGDQWRRERAILEQLAVPPKVGVPTVLAGDEARRVLLLSALPGTPADRSPGDLAWQRSLHRQAGCLRRRLDAVPVDEDDPTPLTDAIVARYRAWRDRARSHLEPELLNRVERSIDPDAFAGAVRRWCHRDLAPNNWIVHERPDGPRLGVIDFGHARPDVWLVDVLKLWDDAWVEHPALEEAFWDGYGHRPTPPERRQLQQLAILHGLATATWGDRHGDGPRSRHGRAVLTRALRESSR